MSLSNPSFETAGAFPGEASGWLVTIQNSLISLGLFVGDGMDTSYVESFEAGWPPELVGFGDFALEFVDGDLSNRREDGFEYEWGSLNVWEELVSVGDARFGEHAEVVTGRLAPWNLTAGQTLEISVGGVAQPTVTLLGVEFVDISQATAQELANAINFPGVAGLQAVTNLNLDGVILRSTAIGGGAVVRVTGGTTNVVLEFPTESAFGAAGDLVEGFELKWGEVVNDLSPPLSTASDEEFESGWSNDDYADEFVGPVLETAPVETFEDTSTLIDSGNDGATDATGIVFSSTSDVTFSIADVGRYLYRDGRPLAVIDFFVSPSSVRVDRTLPPEQSSIVFQLRSPPPWDYLSSI